MARITLKVNKPATPSTVAREPSSRAKRAQLQSQRHKSQPAAPAPSPVATPPAAKRDRSAASTGPRREGAPVKRGDATATPSPASPSTPAATGDAAAAPRLSRSGKPLPAEGSRRRATGAPGASAGGDRARPGGGFGPKRAYDAHKKPFERASADKQSRGSGAEPRPPSARRAPGALSAPSEYRPRTDRGKPRSPRAADAPTAPRAGSASTGSRTGHAASRAAPAQQAKRASRHENPDDPRLSKRMSELGLCSRREADEWIENGWVTVDGKTVDKLGTRVSPFARIEVSKAAAQHQSEQVTVILNKPIGFVSGQAEDGYTPASTLIKPENRWADDSSAMKFKPVHLRGLAPAGRLDIDSTGLIVFTQDGRVAKRLVGDNSGVEKEYLVRVEGKLDDAGLARLQHGLELDGVKLKPARVSWQNEDQLRFVLREGRKRQIRRMCELVGLNVTGLKRVRTGSVSLGALPVGQWRYLRPDEQF